MKELFHFKKSSNHLSLIASKYQRQNSNIGVSQYQADVLFNRPLRPMAISEVIMVMPVHATPNSKVVPIWVGRLSNNFTVYILKHLR